MVVAIHTREFNFSVAAHDGLAFAYAAVVASLLSLSFYDRRAGEYHSHLSRRTFLFHSWSAALLFGVGSFTEALGPINVWYAGVRFRGWAENPNQMALAMVAMPFLGWHLLKQSSSFVGKAGYLLGIGVCSAVGIATQSDALQVGWAAALCTTGALVWYRITLRGRSRWLYLSHLIVPALVVVFGVSMGIDIVEQVGRIMRGIYEAGDQGAKRFTLWLNGLAAIVQSPLVGFGPGPFSGLSGPLEGEEAHNSLIDWGMSTGVTGVFLHLALWGWCLWRTTKSRSGALVGMAVAVMMYSLFGYMLRHPDYWLMLILLLKCAERSTQVASQQAPGLAAAGDPVPPALQIPRPRFRFQQPRMQ
jgi:O-antigen ligase